MHATAQAQTALCQQLGDGESSRCTFKVTCLRYEQEADILEAWPWGQHSIGLATVEHNHEVDKRRRIHDALLSRGMTLAYQVDVDDWFWNSTLYRVSDQV
jgi:hypothetical protein